MEEQPVDVIEETSANKTCVGIKINDHGVDRDHGVKINEHGMDGDHGENINEHEVGGEHGGNINEHEVDGNHDENINEHEVDVDHGTTGKEDEMIPKVGMVFCCYDEAFNFYKEYGRRCGFGVKISSVKYKADRDLYAVVFACSMEGNTRTATWKTSHPYIPTSKANCQAMMFVRTRGAGVRVLEYCILEHNHPINPSMSQFQRCYRNSPAHVKRQHVCKDKAGLLSHNLSDVPVVQRGGYESLLYNQKDSRNHSHQVRQLKLSSDAEAVYQYFTDMQNQNPNFFHRMDLDEEGRIKKVFWADARSRTTYKYFGDIISFNTTYLMNKHDLFFAQFVGVNHHGQLVLLGAGLLADETIEAYIWLFEAWLTCMSCSPPNGIITDQCEAIKAAVAKVFPLVRHRLCECHIMKRVEEKLGRLRGYKAIRRGLVKAVHESLTVDDFEENWKQMIDIYSLQNDQWLKLLYEDRYCWVPVFVKDTFWAGISKTQCNLCMSAVYVDYVTSKASLKQFLQQYESALGIIYEKEAQEDFLSFHTSPKLISELKMEEQLSRVYTINIFRKFQDEVKQLIEVSASLLGKDGPFSTYEVKEFGRDVCVKYRVTYDSVELVVRCMCRLFEFRGILCRHALCVLMCEGVEEIPEKYILNRWRKDLKQIHALPSLSFYYGSAKSKLYNNLSNCGLQLLTDIVELGAVSNERSQFALRLLNETKEKLLRLDCIYGDIQTDQNPSACYNIVDGNLNGNENVGSEIDTSGTSVVGKESSPQLVDCNLRRSMGRKISRVNNQKKKEVVYQNNSNVVDQVYVPSIGPSTVQFSSHLGTQVSFNPTQEGTHLDGQVSNRIHFQELF